MVIECNMAIYFALKRDDSVDSSQQLSRQIFITMNQMVLNRTKK